MFIVGQKVVCVEGEVDPDWHGAVPRIGTVYTVSWTGVSEGWDVEIIDLVELPSPAEKEFERGYQASCFRPVVERKTDISIFTAMLTPSQVTVDALNMADFARELVQ